MDLNNAHQFKYHSQIRKYIPFWAMIFQIFLFKSLKLDVAIEIEKLSDGRTAMISSNIERDTIDVQNVWS